MRQVNIYITDKDYNHFIELVKSLQYVKKIEMDDSDRNKEEILNGLKQAIQEVRMVEASELKSRLLKDLIEELEESYHSSFL